MNKKINLMLIIILTFGSHVFATTKYGDNESMYSKNHPIILKDFNLNKDYSNAFGIKTPIYETKNLKSTAHVFEKSTLLKTDLKNINYNTHYNVMNFQNNFNGNLQVLNINNISLNDRAWENSLLNFKTPALTKDFISLKDFNRLASEKTDLPKLNLNLKNINDDSDEYFTFLRVGKNLKGFGIGLLSLGLLVGLVNLIRFSGSFGYYGFYDPLAFFYIGAFSLPPIVSGSLMLAFGQHYLNKAKRIKPRN